jgi:putative transposase
MNLPKTSTVKARFQKPEGAAALACPNLLKQRFNPQRPNEAWVGDITFVRAGGRFAYVRAVPDLFSRKLIACLANERAGAKLTAEALEAVWETRRRPAGALFHSDRGTRVAAPCAHRFCRKRHKTNRFGTVPFPRKSRGIFAGALPARGACR